MHSDSRCLRTLSHRCVHARAVGRWALLACLAALLPLASGCVYASRVPQTFGSPAAQQRVSKGVLPRPKHVVIVIEENKAYSQIIGNSQAPYLNSLATEGASFTRAYGIRHPSEPNYLALFSGSTHGVTLDSCPHHFTGPNLASELAKAGYSFAIYSQSLPRTGFKGCSKGLYARKHNPVVNWQGANVRPGQNRPFRDFPHNFSQLPTVAFVIPNIDNDMHSASIRKGDAWLKKSLGRYVRWARHHDSLLIVTWDEDDFLHHNHIPTLFVGSMVKPGKYDRQIDHYSLLRTLEAVYHLPLLGKSAKAVPITGIWKHKG